MAKVQPPPSRVERDTTIRPGYCGLELTNTEFGDLVEGALAKRMRWTPLVGALAGKARQGTFDMLDERGVRVEVKAVTVYAQEYKVKSSARANGRKQNIGGATVMVVVERTKQGKLRGWVYRRDAIGCFRLGPSGLGWDFVGKLKVI